MTKLTFYALRITFYAGNNEIMRKTIISLAVIILLVGYSSTAFISSAMAKRLPPVKKVLLKYHREKLLSSDLVPTPLLSPENHPHGWRQPDCLKCHKTPSWQPSDVCIGCHGKNGVLPSWEGPGVGNQKDTCSSCHKTRNKFGYPESGNHASHVLKGPKDKDCLQCHPGNNSITHANGHIDVYFIKGGEYRSSSEFELSQTTLQSNLPTPPPLKGGIGFCSGIACHEDRHWGGEGCEKCHGDPPKTGSHVAHFENHPEATCRDCHKDNEHDEDENSGFIEIGGVKYNNITGYCETKCHDTVKSDKPLRWDCASCHGYPPKSGNHDPSIHKGGCEQCHKNHRHSYKAAVRPWDFSDTKVAFAHGGKYQINLEDKMVGGRCNGLNGCHEERIWGENCADCHGKPPRTSAHVLHLKQEDITCQSCHKNNVHKSLSLQVGYQTEGLIEVGGIKYDATTGKCVSNCHKPLKWDCVDCHGYPPVSGAHNFHNAPSGKIMNWPPVEDTKSLSSRLYQLIFDAKQPGVPCVQCHAGHQHSYKSAVAPMDFTSIQVSFSQGGNYNPEDGLCSNIACHEPLKWQSRCSDCHGVPPDTGLHKVHLQRPGVNCDICHKKRQHDLDDKSGTIDIGGITYDKFTGRCVSSCHENRNSELLTKGEESWGCTSCHGNPPDTGQHLVHSTGRHITSKGKINLGCHTCHADHKHSYKAATTPNDYNDATVKFSIRGNWDKSKKVCSNVGCHDDRNWVREGNQH
ncbi:MAG: hypothetical protein ACE5PV_20620 [Candidatus Poribacteria bacterium]